jgi:hypothetical protein
MDELDAQLRKFHVMGIRFCAAHCRLLAAADLGLTAGDIALLLDDLADSIEKSDEQYRRAQSEEDK